MGNTHPSNADSLPVFPKEILILIATYANYPTYRAMVVAGCPVLNPDFVSKKRMDNIIGRDFD
jgi:hypothetical protein